MAWTASSGSLSATSGTSTTSTPSVTGASTVTATTLYVTVSTIPNATIGLRVLRNGGSYAGGTFSTA